MSFKYTLGNGLRFSDYRTGKPLNGINVKLVVVHESYNGHFGTGKTLSNINVNTRGKINFGDFGSGKTLRDINVKLVLVN